MKQSLKAILIHGNGDSTPEDNWLPYVKIELEKLGIYVISKQFPDTPLAREKFWIPFLEQLGVDENTILIGHSSGAIAALRYAEQNKILGSVLVGAYVTDLGMESEKQSGYFDRPWNWQSIKKNQQWTILFASENDPWIPIEEPRVIRDKITPDYYEFKNQGHFGGDYFKKTFPELIDAIKRRLEK